MSDITITIIFLLLLSYLIFIGNTWLFFSILHFDELREKKDNKVHRVESEWKLEISGILWDNLKIFLNISENLQPFFLLLNSDFGSFWSFEVAIFLLISYRSVFSPSHWRHWDSILSHTATTTSWSFLSQEMSQGVFVHVRGRTWDQTEVVMGLCYFLIPFFFSTVYKKAEFRERLRVKLIVQWFLRNCDLIITELGWVHWEYSLLHSAGKTWRWTYRGKHTSGIVGLL